MELDADLRSIHEARELAVRAKEAQKAFAMADQATVDRICEAMVAAAMANAARLGQLAHEETGFGNPIHKRLKNELAAQGVWDNIKDQKTCGEIGRDEARRIVEYGAPVGVVMGLSPSTNPTATAIFKTLINVKARNAFILAPHPTAKKCTAEAIRVIVEAGEAAGMPKGLVSCVSEVHPAGTDELFHHYAVSMILATGGPGMVKAAHSAGKPAIGVGPGNVPVYVDRSANAADAGAKIVDSKAFDCSTICATEQLVLADAPIAAQLRDAMKANGAHWLSKDEAKKLANMMFRANGLMHASFVAKTPQRIGELAGISVPADARILVADLDEIGPNEPLSREKLTTVLGFMEVKDWRDGCERSIECLKFGGDGHSIAMHCEDMNVIQAFGEQKPAYRVVVNTWSCLGATGATTAIDPTFTIGPGGVGGAVTSDNVTLRHVLNVRRVIWPVREPHPDARARTVQQGSASSSGDQIEEIVRRVVAELKRS